MEGTKSEKCIKKAFSLETVIFLVVFGIIFGALGSRMGVVNLMNTILNTAFDGYAPYKGDIQYRKQGSLIAFETGEAVTYGLFSAQDRGTLFIGPGEKVYSGMVIGQSGKPEDIELNVCKTKHLTNTRSSSADEALKLTPPRNLSLEQALEFIDTDELLEVTPESLRMRKKTLDSRLRKRESMKK